MVRVRVRVSSVCRTTGRASHRPPPLTSVEECRSLEAQPPRVRVRARTRVRARVRARARVRVRVGVSVRVRVRTSS